MHALRDAHGPLDHRRHLRAVVHDDVVRRELTHHHQVLDPGPPSQGLWPEVVHAIHSLLEGQWQRDRVPHVSGRGALLRLDQHRQTFLVHDRRPAVPRCRFRQLRRPRQRRVDVDRPLEAPDIHAAGALRVPLRQHHLLEILEIRGAMQSLNRARGLVAEGQALLAARDVLLEAVTQHLVLLGAQVLLDRLLNRLLVLVVDRRV
mmetsp:Transcript_104556/g.320266  ORF Transcript_104556/g.320266 Transcript_104556/m.320266 type:complete len:204 (+) Transcript_104556:614-1225(+)